MNVDPARIESWATELTAAAQEISIGMGADLPDLQLASREEVTETLACALRIPAYLGSSPIWDEPGRVAAR